jgi:hypothetical protein
MAECIVLMAKGSPALDSLRERLQHARDIALIDVADTMPAVESLASQKPAVLLLGQTVAWSGPGWEFVERFRSVSPETDIRILPQGEAASLLHRGKEALVTPVLVAASFPLPRIPARRSVRRSMPEGKVALVNGRNASLINLSPFGAQVVTPLVLKPAQQVRFALSDQTQRVRATVAWSVYELRGEPTGPQYRVGLAFHAELPLSDRQTL